jgi:hypothetical protein
VVVVTADIERGTFWIPKCILSDRLLDLIHMVASNVENKSDNKLVYQYNTTSQLKTKL